MCDWKGINIIEAKVCPDMLVEMQPKQSVAGFVGFLKGRNSLIIHQRHGNLKYKYGNRWNTPVYAGGFFLLSCFIII